MPTTNIDYNRIIEKIPKEPQLLHSPSKILSPPKAYYENFNFKREELLKKAALVELNEISNNSYQINIATYETEENDVIGYDDKGQIIIHSEDKNIVVTNDIIAMLSFIIPEEEDENFMTKTVKCRLLMYDIITELSKILSEEIVSKIIETSKKEFDSTLGIKESGETIKMLEEVINKVKTNSIELEVIVEKDDVDYNSINVLFNKFVVGDLIKSWKEEWKIDDANGTVKVKYDGEADDQFVKNAEEVIGSENDYSSEIEETPEGLIALYSIKSLSQIILFGIASGLIETNEQLDLLELIQDFGTIKLDATYVGPLADIFYHLTRLKGEKAIAVF